MRAQCCKETPRNSATLFDGKRSHRKSPDLRLEPLARIPCGCQEFDIFWPHLLKREPEQQLDLANQQAPAARLLRTTSRGDGRHPSCSPATSYSSVVHRSARSAINEPRHGLARLLGVLRMQGRISWGDVLDLTRELDEWQTYGSPREARAALRRRYDEDRWIGQPSYPILIVEKDTLEPVCKPMAMRWQMPFASSRGYGSLTLQHDVAQMLRDRHAKTKQPAMIYFISDLDPSGLDLQRAWEEALDNFNVPYALTRIGLTLAQVQAIPNERLRQGIEVKESDSRSARYIAEYGNRCWETDILPGSDIEAALDTHIRSWINAAAWARRDAEIERARGLL